MRSFAHSLTRNIVGTLVVAGTAFVSSAALADGPQQINIAATHAGLASQAGDINGVKMHLHHTLNCLVGPSGMGFDAGAGNPCANAGQGAIPETADAGMKQKLEAAAGRVRGGFAIADYAAAKQTAADVAGMLK